MTSTATLTRLAPLIGTWRTAGEVLDEGGRHMVGTIEGTDAYEWLGTALILHRVAVTMSGAQVDQLEVIGPYDHERDELRTCAYDGASGAVEHATADVEPDGTMLFRAGSDVARAQARIRVADDGRTMAGGWSRTVDDGATWVPWLRMRWERQGVAVGTRQRLRGVAESPMSPSDDSG